MADPVAAKSAFLCMYMSNHPDTLVSYVRHWGRVAVTVSSAQMSAIDTTGMTLQYKTPDSAQHEARIAFDPPLAGYEEVKPRLMLMKAEAEETLGMTRAPQISTFRLPRVVSPLILYAFLLYVTFAPSLSPSPSPSPFTPAPALASPAAWLSLPGATLRSALPAWALPAGWGVLVATHVLESLYTLSLCRRHRTGARVGAQYVGAAFLFGFPVWADLRRRVQEARIESIVKGQ